MQKINLNSTILIKPTPDDFKVWYEHQKAITEKVNMHLKNSKFRIRTLESITKEADKNGFVEMQMFEFIKIFGSSIRGAGSILPCEGNIYLP